MAKSEFKPPTTLQSKLKFKKLKIIPPMDRYLWIQSQPECNRSNHTLTRKILYSREKTFVCDT